MIILACVIRHKEHAILERVQNGYLYADRKRLIRIFIKNEAGKLDLLTLNIMKLLLKIDIK